MESKRNRTIVKDKKRVCISIVKIIKKLIRGQLDLISLNNHHKLLNYHHFHNYENCVERGWSLVITWDCILFVSGWSGPSPSSLLLTKNDQPLQHQCPHCLKGLSSRQSLLRHIEDRHVVTQPYRCVICGSLCKTKNALQKHHYTYHRGLPLRIF